MGLRKETEVLADEGAMLEEVPLGSDDSGFAGPFRLTGRGLGLGLGFKAASADEAVEMELCVVVALRDVCAVCMLETPGRTTGLKEEMSETTERSTVKLAVCISETTTEDRWFVCGDAYNDVETHRSCPGGPWLIGEHVAWGRWGGP